MSRIYLLRDVIDDIQQLCNSFSTQKKVAEFLEISEQHLTDILHHRRNPGEKVLMKLGFQKFVVYKYVGKEKFKCVS